MATWHLRGVVLPEGEVRDLYVHGDRVGYEAVPGAETVVDGGFLLPGLVDAHLHPGTAAVGAPLDEDLLRAHGEKCRDAGVSVIRVPGSASRLPGWFGADPTLPRVQEAGIAVAAEGGFFPGWGRQVTPGDIPVVAVEEASRSGWCKLIADWMTDDGGYAPSMSPEVIADATRRVHDVGARIAVHAQHADGGAAAVDAGVDSVEHGMHLPRDVLAKMAARGTALVPTAVTFAALAPQMTSQEVPAATRAWYDAGWRGHPELVRAAYDAGVTVLAGTDLPPGSLVDEIRWLAGPAGLPIEAALGAACWTARDWLGLPAGLSEGAPADVVALDADPRADLGALEHPRRVIHRGRIIGQPSK